VFLNLFEIIQQDEEFVISYLAAWYFDKLFFFEYTAILLSETKLSLLLFIYWVAAGVIPCIPDWEWIFYIW
jgi:hypothetical protein